MEPFSAHPHGSGTGVGSGAVGHTSSPEQMLERRLYETSDEQMMSRTPLGVSSPHDGNHGSLPHGGHHEGVTMTIGDSANDMTMNNDYDDWGQGGDHR